MLQKCNINKNNKKGGNNPFILEGKKYEKIILILSLFLSSCASMSNQDGIDLINAFKPSQADMFCDFRNQTISFNCKWFNN